jgi:hypothetical protein
MSSVYLSNLSPTTTKESLDKFMVCLITISTEASHSLTSSTSVSNASQAFCGSIQSIEMHEANKAIVTFEKPSAASTALMLNGE